MEHTPSVSVIVIFFNAERFLAAALESVLAQTFGDWELLLVDDGSTDGSSAIAQRFVQQQPDRVCYLEHPRHSNRGMSASRNLGLRHARGRYVAFLDADDVWLPQKLAQQVALLETHPEAALVYGLTHYWYGWTGLPEDALRDYTPALGVQADTVIASPTLLTLALAGRAPTPCPSDILVRRTVVEAVGGFEAKAFAGTNQLYEDQAFLAKVYLHAPVFVAGRSWFRYRQHADSCVSVSERMNRAEVVGRYYCDWLKRYLRAHKVTNARLWLALESRRWRYRHPHLVVAAQLIRQRVGQLSNTLKRLARHVLPTPIYCWLKDLARQREWSRMRLSD